MINKLHILELEHQNLIGKKMSYNTLCSIIEYTNNQKKESKIKQMIRKIKTI